MILQLSSPRSVTTEEGDLRRNIEIAADARRRHWQATTRPRPAGSGPRIFPRVRIRLHDRGGDLHLKRCAKWIVAYETASNHRFQAEISRLPPTPAPTLANDDAPAPSRVWAANFSASAFDFMIVAATCICTPPDLAARRLVTMLIISIAQHSNTGTLPGSG